MKTVPAWQATLAWVGVLNATIGWGAARQWPPSLIVGVTLAAVAAVLSIALTAIGWIREE